MAQSRRPWLALEVRSVTISGWQLPRGVEKICVELAMGPAGAEAQTVSVEFLLNSKRFVAEFFSDQKMAGDWYFSPLVPGIPERGMGAYEMGTGKLLYYSDGGQWFYEARSGRAAFYMDAGGLRWVLPR